MSRLLGIVGPTASGKTELSIGVASALDAEIVCCDSMLVYRGLDVGTAKPTPEQRRAVPHHMLDLVGPEEEFSVQRYQEEVRRVLDDIASRRKTALLVGGSGLYVRAALDPLEFPPTDPFVRAKLEKREPEDLGRELRCIDPVSAAEIDPANVRRIIRAVEVHVLTGRPFSSFRCGWESFSPVPMAGLCPPASVHRERIRARAQAMIDGGLLDETRALFQRGASRTASAALGYAEARDLLTGRTSRDEAVEAIAARTRALARRQRSWFRSDARVAWFGGAEPSQLIAYFRSAA